MDQDLISKKTRNLLRELLVSWVLREIEMEFDAAGIWCDRSHNPAVGGARRSFVEQHYHTLNFSNADDAKRFLIVLEAALNKTSRQLADQPDLSVRRKLDDLIDALKIDGFVYTDGKVSPSNSVTRKAFGQVSGHPISELTRRYITESLLASKINWYGRFSETDFLGRLYDLTLLPSTDSRFKNALGDVIQHRENNDDWDNGWVFTDDRLGLADSDEAFLRFLCEMVHPVVRNTDGEIEDLVKMFNQYLRKDGWELYEGDYISGKPVFMARHVSLSGTALDTHIKVLAAKVDSTYIANQTTRMMDSIEDDPELAIGTAKELVETVCKTILIDRSITFSKAADLPELNKATFKALCLMPDDIPEHAKGSEIIKRMLSNLAAVTQGLAELRGLYGTGHGKHGRTKSVLPRHARLAVGASSTLATFLYETHLHNQQQQGPNKGAAP